MLVLDLAGPAASAVVHGPSGGWSHPLGVRHAEILLSLAQHPQGRSAAELAARSVLASRAPAGGAGAATRPGG